MSKENYLRINDVINFIFIFTAVFLNRNLFNKKNNFSFIYIKKIKISLMCTSNWYYQALKNLITKENKILFLFKINSVFFTVTLKKIFDPLPKKYKNFLTGNYYFWLIKFNNLDYDRSKRKSF